MIRKEIQSIRRLSGCIRPVWTQAQQIQIVGEYVVMFVARYEGARYVLCLYIDPATNQLGKWVYIFAEQEILTVVTTPCRDG